MAKDKQEISKQDITSVSEADLKGEKVLVVLEPEKIRPAGLVGVRNELKLSEQMKASLPEEFQGTTLETLDTTLPPSVKWLQPGEYVGGVYEGSQEGIGPNKSMLYNFDARGKKFSIWGTTTLDRVFSSGQIDKGDMLLITYIGDIETDNQPCKMFDIKKAAAKKA